ncbi:hypothetical protein V1498_09735 [Peribacillus sp. SCS-26]|uniref:hypothetical protein n=1 Tax=Paraperibacillus marinus TaxID=3115295 RepID=UPI0039064255
MTGKFFADYSQFIVIPEEEKKTSTKEFNPADFASHFILTLSLYDALVTKWSDAGKYEVVPEKGIETVLEDFNLRQRDAVYLQLLELDKEKSYFVMALSIKEELSREESALKISQIVEKMLTNPFYIGQSWYKLIGDKGRIQRKLFCFSFKEYTAGG